MDILGQINFQARCVGVRIRRFVFGHIVHGNLCIVIDKRITEIVANMLDPSAHATPLTGPRCGNVLMHSPVSQDHILAVASADAVRRRCENRSQSISQIVPLWPLKVPKRSPFSLTHNDSFQVNVEFDKANNFVNAMSHIHNVVDSIVIEGSLQKRIPMVELRSVSSCCAACERTGRNDYSLTTSSSFMDS